MSYCKLGRISSQRKAMLRGLTTDLSINERIVTTEARAKEACSTVEETITLGKYGDLHARRQAAAFVRNEVASVREESGDIVIESASQEPFNDTASHYAERQGGYTYILKTESRRGNGAPMVVLEFV